MSTGTLEEAIGSSLNVIFMLISVIIVKKHGFLSEFTLQHEKEIIKVCKLEQGKF